jgi:hypothetical protein
MWVESLSQGPWRSPLGSLLAGRLDFEGVHSAFCRSPPNVETFWENVANQLQGLGIEVVST